MYFPAHCVAVTNISPHYNLLPHREHRRTETQLYERVDRPLFQIAAVQRVQRHAWHSGALALSANRQSARMSKIKYSGLDQYGKV